MQQKLVFLKVRKKLIYLKLSLVSPYLFTNILGNHCEKNERSDQTPVRKIYLVNKTINKKYVSVIYDFSRRVTS